VRRSHPQRVPKTSPDSPKKEEEGEGSQREDVYQTTFWRKILMANRVYTWEKPTWTNSKLKSTGEGDQREVILQPHQPNIEKNINAGVEDNDSGMEKVNKKNPFVESRERQRCGVIASQNSVFTAPRFAKVEILFSQLPKTTVFRKRDDET
jgi:hypothetical protein